MLHSIFMPFGAAMTTIISSAVLGADITLAHALLIGALGGVGAWMDEQAEEEEEEDDA